MAKSKKDVVEMDVARQVRNCRLFYKLGLVPSEEKLDPTPLTVPLGCETPLTRKEMFQMFGYGSYSNPNLYDDDESEDEWDEGNSYTEFPLSKDEIITDDGKTLNELEVSLKQDEDAVKDKLYQEHLAKLSSRDVETQSGSVAETTEPVSGEGASESTVPVS